MHIRRTILTLGAVVLATLSLPLAALSEPEAKRAPMKIEGKETLPLRVLSRAFSNIYKGPDANSGTVHENVPAFESYYVYSKKAGNGDLDKDGWYEVGSDTRGTVLGWMSSKDVFEWKQTMCLAYTHPEGRWPVLMFDKKEGVEKLTKMPEAERKENVEKLYLDIAAGELTPDFPVVTIEPKKAIDIAKEFYLLPILEFSEIELNNREARILKLAAVTKESADARQSSDIRTNKDFLREANLGKDEVSPETLEKLGVDIVWVMDTTNSMKPYIDRTLKVVEEASKRLAQNTELARSLRFGIWGYRDSMSIPDIGYNVKNYTPSLQSIEQFVPVLKNVDVATAGSEGYAEDMFSGVHGALDKTAWTPDAIRLVVLVGDAPAHEVGHKWNATGQNQETLRAIANDRSISIFAIHIKDPEAEQYHATAMEQMQLLGANKGQEGGPAYYSTASTDLVGFENVTKDVTNAVIEFLSEAKKKKNLPVVSPQGGKNLDMTATVSKPSGANLDLFKEESANPLDSSAPLTKSMGNAALKAAFVEWVGSQTGAQAPRDVVAWVTDKDLLTTDTQSLEVRLLITKGQLDSLRETLKAILEAGRKGQTGGEDFFSSLQAAAATTARDPEMIKQAKSLVQTGLVPEFLAGLPYKSRIMDMNNELWSSWSVDEQDRFLADVEARIMAYETIHDSPEGWVQLNKQDEPGDYVYPITLDLLP